MSKTLIVHTKSLDPCVQCDMTLKAADREGVAVLARPGIDTVERAAELHTFKTEHGLAAAPIVEVDDGNGVIVDRWAGFQPHKIKEHAR